MEIRFIPSIRCFPDGDELLLDLRVAAAPPYGVARPPYTAQRCLVDGDLLARLSPQQIRDAFRAGGNSADEVEQFSMSDVLAELEKL